MKNDWVPVSAALLATGAMALAAATFLAPHTGAETSETLRIVAESGGQWMVVAVTYFLASICLILGLPALVVGLRRKGRAVGVVGAGTLAAGILGLAGYATLMIFLRSLVVTDALDPGELTDAATETGLLVFIYAWVALFYLGEALVAIGLWRSGPKAAPRWAPVLIGVHVALAPVQPYLPSPVVQVSVLLVAVPLAAVAIQVTTPDHDRPAARPRSLA